MKKSCAGTGTTSSYDRQIELKAFDDTKAGVKGLVDAGVTKVPRIFIDENDKPNNDQIIPIKHLEFPVIDLKGASRSEIVKQVKEACMKWRFFQIVNHELPLHIMDEMIEGVRRFHEQDAEVKKKYYTRDPTKKFQYNSNMQLYSTISAASWKDHLLGRMFPHPPQPHELPDVCRDIMFEYSEQVIKVGHTLYELLSEALGLSPSHLKDIGCIESVSVTGHYYPACPEPEHTFGIREHVDHALLTILLQDQTGGCFQVHVQDHYWVDVPVIPGGLIINVGDFFQLITNDKFKSVRHRSVVKKDSKRISIATFMTPIPSCPGRLYGPIKDLITKDEPAIYKETTYKDYLTLYFSQVANRTEKLLQFKL